MAEQTKSYYQIEAIERLAETPDLRVSVFTIGRGQEIPWHWHTHVSDYYIGM